MHKAEFGGINKRQFGRQFTRDINIHKLVRHKRFFDDNEDINSFIDDVVNYKRDLGNMIVEGVRTFIDTFFSVNNKDDDTP